MAQDPVPGGEAAVSLEGGTYEIIRNRLTAHGQDLLERLGRLNERRREIFGAIETTLLATERISTANNCMPRDMAQVDSGRFLFGYNVQMGLRSQVQIEDVFSLYRYEDHTFTTQPVDLLRNGRFEDDFKDLYRYYKHTVFAKFSRIGPYLFMVFRTGRAVTDIKTFKWLVDGERFTYVDNRSDHEFTLPPQHDFTWSRTNRDFHRTGLHPHISLEDRVFVEAVGGDITFKVEDNTESGQGIYSEPVDNPDQTLDDAEIHYASLGHLILVRVRPYMEDRFRYFIYNEKVQEVCRVDEIEDACVLLPDDQGLIFSNGYYLQAGELKKFESGLTGMVFERRLASGNGEDYLYVFYNRESGDHILLPYNVIEQRVENPLFCHGFSCFENGELLFFRAEAEPKRHHAVQIWQTPYVRGEHALAEKRDDFLYKVGNSDIVRAMAECHELVRLVRREDVYASLYLDLVKKATDLGDAYFWLANPEAFNLREVIAGIKSTASQAIDEFEKVRRLRQSTVDQVARVTAGAREVLDRVAAGHLEKVTDFVGRLADLRSVRGEIISLRELRYIDSEAVEALDGEVAAATDTLSADCVRFLLQPEALDPYSEQVAAVRAEIESLERVAEGKSLQEKVDETAGQLEMLIEIVGNLKIDDATQTTRIIDAVSNIYAELNQVRSTLGNRIQSLAGREGLAEFNAQLKLLNQAVINYLDLSDTPEKCDDYLTRVMVQVEDLEGRFADFDEFVLQLTEKRDELYSAFEARKVRLVEARNRKATTLMQSAERIVKGIATRVAAMDDIEAINGYFAADLMVDKVRDIVSQLQALGDSVKADDLQARLKTVREDTVRQLKDRHELFEDGQDVIRFGPHRFSVNRQPLDLTVVRRGEDQFFHLTGTGFFAPITDAAFLDTRPVWEMTLPSEDREVYRGEYLAYRLLEEYDRRSPDDRRRLAGDSVDALRETVQQFMGPRYREGYTKGVHDADAARILAALLEIHERLGVLRHAPRVRALARVFWALYEAGENRSVLSTKLEAFGQLEYLFPGQTRQENYRRELEELLTAFAEESGIFSPADAGPAARYLFSELSTSGGFSVCLEALHQAEEFEKHLRNNRYLEKFKTARTRLHSRPLAEFELLRDWIRGFAAADSSPAALTWCDEAAALMFLRGRGEGHPRQEIVEADVIRDVTGMVGDHPRVRAGDYTLDYYAFIDRLAHFETQVRPRYEHCQELKKRLTGEMRATLRLEEFKPRILTSFVRNRLINRVYLPLVGDNLAKQIGVVGEGKRTDLMGLLLLISPPGYGKTTLMEYLANRLGVIFMKINGPAIGSRVTSLDPDEAPFASAREEVQKLNLALEMGDNVMIYLDDIQHCHPEFLQKFISLCDAQRKIEGVYQGRSRTYDLRGKKVVVVMAGNPYTESGEKFKIPDMLANRADTYNLGDILGDNREDFELSFLENSLTSNPYLNRLASRSQQDVYALVRIAETGSHEGAEFEGNYGREAVDEMAAVMEKLIRVRGTVLKVNQAYILSAGQSDAYRTEPPFLLQGSYRNMNRLAEKIVPIMNDDELRTLVLSHYENEAQTLTTGAEANLLKFKALAGWMDATETARWEEILKTFRKLQTFHGTDAADPVNRVVAQLAAFQDGLGSIRDALAAETRRPSGVERKPARLALDEATLARIETAMQALQATVNSSAPDAPPAFLPPELILVLKKQLRLMDSWMVPTLEETVAHSKGMERLLTEIEQLKTAFRGVIREKGDFDEGLVYYNTALAKDPKNAEAYYNRSVIWYQKHDVRRALSDAQNALTLDPKKKKFQRFVTFLESEVTSRK